MHINAAKQQQDLNRLLLESRKEKVGLISLLCLLIENVQAAFKEDVFLRP